jgi:DNA-directed RNA polymerase subunit K/omega
MSVKPVDLKKIQEIAGNTYEAIVIIAKRARQINDERKIMFNQRIEELKALKSQQEGEESPRHLEDEEFSQPKTSTEQLQIAKEFEQMPKPADQAIQEYLDGKLTWNYEKRKFIR